MSFLSISPDHGQLSDAFDVFRWTKLLSDSLTLRGTKCKMQLLYTIKK